MSPLLLLVTPFTAELARFPGRLLTGTEPLLVPTNAMSRIELLLGRAAPEAAPVWVAAATPVSYTHLDVYKRQRLERAAVREWRADRASVCLLYTSRCV